MHHIQNLVFLGRELRNDASGAEVSQPWAFLFYEVRSFEGCAHDCHLQGISAARFTHLAKVARMPVRVSRNLNTERNMELRAEHLDRPTAVVTSSSSLPPSLWRLCTASSFFLLFFSFCDGRNRRRADAKSSCPPSLPPSFRRRSLSSLSLQLDSSLLCRL